MLNDRYHRRSTCVIFIAKSFVVHLVQVAHSSIGLSPHSLTAESTLREQFESVLARSPNENSVLTLEAPEKRESESSGPIFRTDGRNLEGCVRETEISLQTESAAVWVGETRKA